jgi:hypothetical protein
MAEHLTCRHPDRDEPRIMCGYSLPCPWHTVIIHADRQPVTVEIPVTSDAMKSPMRERLGSIARAVTPLPRAKKSRRVRT